MKAKTFLTLLLVLASGFSLGWLTRGGLSDREDRVVALAHYLERLGFSANSLSNLQAGHENRLQSLLWLGMTSSLEGAERETAAGATLPPFNPNLLEAVERARRVAEESGRSDLVSRLTTLRDAVASRKPTA